MCTEDRTERVDQQVSACALKVGSEQLQKLGIIAELHFGAGKGTGSLASLAALVDLPVQPGSPAPGAGATGCAKASRNQPQFLSPV